MRTITNTHNLPEAIVRAVVSPSYKKVGHISVTGLIDSPRVRALTQRHEDEISEDASERLWALLGTAMHHILHKAADKNSLTEERMGVDVLGWRVTGQPDVYDSDGTLTDYKVSGHMSVVGEVKDTWKMQLRVYAWLLAQHGFTVNKAQVCVLIRDWIRSKTFDEDYPQAPMVVLPVDLWDADKIKAYVENRVRLHQISEDSTDDKLSECDAGEKWLRPDTWAVIKKGNKRAYRVFRSKIEADVLAAANGMETVHRPGEAVRCKSYCSVAKFCDFGRSVQAGEK